MIEKETFENITSSAILPFHTVLILLGSSREDGIMIDATIPLAEDSG
jgi:hypothetical protein